MEMRCVQCGHGIDKLYIQYSPGNIRLVRCSNCNAVADEYIECELMIILIDLILHKAKAYRHLLFNSFGRETINFRSLLFRLSLVYLLLDAYKMLFVNGSYSLKVSSSVVSEALLSATVGNLVFVCVLIILTRRLLRFVDGFSGWKEVLLAVLVSSYLKLFLVATMVWEFPVTICFVVDLVVMSSNLVALKVIADSSSIRRCFVVCFGTHACKLLSSWLVHLLLVR